VVVSVRLIAGNRKTGINTYESTGLKWHTKFVKDSQWERKFIKTPGFLDSKGAPDDLYIESFFNWLWGDPQVTWNIFKTCLSWCQWVITTRRLAEFKLKELEAHVRKIPVVKVLRLLYAAELYATIVCMLHMLLLIYAATA
jgi:hypothetical protein